MTREEKCQLAKTRGYSYNAETGQVVNKHGKQIKKNLLKQKQKNHQKQKKQLLLQREMTDLIQ